MRGNALGIRFKIEFAPTVMLGVAADSNADRSSGAVMFAFIFVWFGITWGSY